jgi:hypothetical protein
MSSVLLAWTTHAQDEVTAIISESSNSAPIEIELESTDEGRLSSEGIFKVQLRVKNADYVDAVYENTTLQTRSVVNDGDWQPVIFTLTNFNEAGVYDLTFTAYNATENAAVEQTISVVRDGSTPAAPNTGILSFRSDAVTAWTGGALLVSLLGAIGWFAWRRMKRGSGRILKK